MEMAYSIRMLDRMRLTLLTLLALLLPTTLAAQSSLPVNYQLDASSSDVTARVSFLGLGSKTARFPRMEGTVTIVPSAPEQASVEVTFDTEAIEAGDETTRNRLRGEKFFWAERHPTIRFVGQSLNMVSSTRGTVTGQLTARGITRTETLSVEFDRNPIAAPQGIPISFTGAMTINRRDYGMRSYQLIVGNNVAIELRARMVPQ